MTSSKTAPPRTPAGRAALVAVSVIAVLALVLTLAPRGRSPETASGPANPEAYPADVRLRRLMSEGPGPGLWTRQTLDGTADWVVLADEEEPDCLLVASVSDDDEVGPASRWARSRAAAFFAPGSADLFFRNYVRRAHPVVEEDLVHEVWTPRNAAGGETARHLWLSRASGEIERLEDRSFLGFCVRSLDRLGPVPERVVRGRLRSCGMERPKAPARPPAVVAKGVPFALLAPTFLPEGFELVDSGYNERSAASSGEDEPLGPGAPALIRMAYLTYSDGLAAIALGITTPEEMDAFEREKARQPYDPDSCPPLPEGVRTVEEGGRLIRRRHDRCRTVLRLDSAHGVSVALLARNELPVGVYVRTIASVVPVPPADDGRR